MRTEQQRAGDGAEDHVARRLAEGGWQILARRQRLGREELDLVGLDPGPPPALVIVEVRWRGGRDFGLPEETFDWRKRRHLRRAAGRLLQDGLPGRRLPPGLPIRIDLIVVEPPLAGTEPRMRHHRHALG